MSSTNFDELLAAIVGNEKAAFYEGARQGYLNAVNEGRSNFNFDDLRTISGFSAILAHGMGNPHSRVAYEARAMDAEFDKTTKILDELRDYIDWKAVERAELRRSEGNLMIASNIMDNVIQDARDKKKAAEEKAARDARIAEADKAEAEKQARKAGRQTAAPKPDEKPLPQEGKMATKPQDDLDELLSGGGGKSKKGKK